MSSLLKNLCGSTVAAMRIGLSFWGATLLMVGAVQAGPMELEPKETAPPPDITSSEPWHFNLGSPGWLASVSGTIGLRGINSHVDVDFDEIIRHVNGLLSLSAEARKGRFGVYGDVLYLNLRDAVYPERMISKANLNVSEYLADGEVFYRVYEGPRGWIDLRAGARFTSVYSSLDLFGNSRLIDQAAAKLGAAADEDLRKLLERLIHGGLGGDNPSLPIPPLGAEEKLKLLKLIRAARQDPMRAEQKIAKVLNKELNRSFSLLEYWADPYVGVSGRYNLTKAFYLTGKVDVGGFGVASDVTVQASGALGCQITRSIYSEIGYRYLYDDYKDNGNGFLYKVSTQGAQITTGIIF
jgi:hypothetical protein